MVRFSFKDQLLLPGIYWVSENALMMRSSQPTELLRAREVLTWSLSIKTHEFPEVLSLIPAADSFAILLKDGEVSSPQLLDQLRQLRSRPLPDDTSAFGNDDSLIEIEVRYGGKNGPDLQALAELSGLSVNDVIARHSSATYVVAFTGFAPGFGYLLGLPPELAMPRRNEPRVEVPQGSVAIGGSFTGIYPHNLPGGWNIIGKTDRKIWDLTLNPPALLVPGRRIRFKPI